MFQNTKEILRSKSAVGAQNYTQILTAC